MTLNYPISANRNEHTRLLVEAGVAEIALRGLHAFYPWTTDIPIEQCYYWATRANEPAYKFSFPVPVVEVAVQYPYRSDLGTYYSVHGMVVATGGAPYPLTATGESLSPEQVALVTQLADPPREPW